MAEPTPNPEPDTVGYVLHMALMDAGHRFSEAAHAVPGLCVQLGIDDPSTLVPVIREALAVRAAVKNLPKLAGDTLVDHAWNDALDAILRAVQS